MAAEAEWQAKGRLLGLLPPAELETVEEQVEREKQWIEQGGEGSPQRKSSSSTSGA